jgi:hypothetical protein
MRELVGDYPGGPLEGASEEEIAAFQKKHTAILNAAYREAHEIGAECFLTLMDQSPVLAAKIYKSIVDTESDRIINNPIILISLMTGIAKNLV